ncbi:ABC transporter permease [Actinacidiphila sp. DG2A-62]|jgi:ABC-2 type transport system permease protein|uniref:ABC transporter permease n=1 Tax=Actinacidiphila sp. DG2A-62 TaxID=3108821 RepID=UPI002DB76078|nr:ABC transporter permease [Actinacidiphila sp. DG2A-62]MEC3997270.1 ABC transporter permease [Actinacidiphila sp. DG2A-62]
MAAPSAVLQSEWTKVKSVRSTVWTLTLALLLTVVVSGLICLAYRINWDDMSLTDKFTFDPTNTSLAGLFLGQLALIAFGTLLIASEYSTGMIRTSLAAVPQRTTFYVCKAAVAAALTFVIGIVISFVSFFVGQGVLSGHKTASLGDAHVVRALVGAAIYMTLMVLFAYGVATMVRSPMVALGTLIPFFFIVSSILSAIPGVKKVAKYLPDQAGQKIMQVVADPDNHTSYGPWGGIAIMAVWVAAALLGGFVLLKSRDA